MSRGLNRSEFIGRAGGDVELRSTAAGRAVASFCLAVAQAVREGAMYSRRRDLIVFVDLGNWEEF